VNERPTDLGSDAATGDLPVEMTEDGVRRRRVLRLSILPTMCTLGNSVCGFLAICYAADAAVLLASPSSRAAGSAKLAVAGWMIVLGMVFDMLDGRIARLTRSTSSFGGALDSLADVVSFGMAPALVAKTLCQGVLGWDAERVVFATAAFFAGCATLRLARYNAEHEEPDQAVTNFRGLPTPGAAGVVAGLAIAHEDVLRSLDPEPFARVAAAQVVAFAVLIGLGLLMVSRVPFTHFANRFLSGRKPVGRLALFLLVVALMVATGAPHLVVAGGFLLYALSGPVAVLVRLLRGRREEVPELFD
jgi:CDP-diacylglycerol--serine O-phosphatidyltransferase